MVTNLALRLLRTPRGTRLRDRMLSRWPMLRPPQHAANNLTVKRMLNYYLAYYEHVNKRIVLRSRPSKLIIEPTNVCNLGCPACFTGDGQTGRVRSSISMELYERLLDELGAYLFRIDFSNWGEPLLNKNLETMIASATKRGISTLISTNFSFPFDDARAERIVAAGLTILGVSLDGARQETYEQYRVRGKIETVLENCRKINAAKRRLGSRTPIMGWEFHVFEHNTDDVEQARAMARELEMEIAVEKGWVVGEEWDTAGKWSFSMKPFPMPCVYLWQYGVVNNDGGVSPCCGTFYREDDVGRLSVKPGDGGAATFREVWNGERFQAARRLYHSRSGPAEVRESICYDCPQTVIYEDLQQHLAQGGLGGDFVPRFTINDIFNYFWTRRAPQRQARRAG
jgi:organic radical activating enzyme